MIVGGRVRLTATGRALKHRNFRFFFFGQLVSVIGTWMQTVAQSWLLITLVGRDNAAFYLGMLGVAQFAPTLILGLFGGMIADLWPKRFTVIGTQLVSGILAAILAALVFTNTVQVWHIFALGLALGLVNAVDMPTRQSFVVEMVGHEDVANAVALNSAVFNSARIIGPAVAGILVAVVGTGVCFLFNAISYLAVIVGLVMMRDEELHVSDRPPMPRSVGAVRENLAEGVSYVWRTPIILLVVSVIAVVSTFGMNFNVVLPAMAAGVLNAGSVGWGLLSSAMGVGALLAALVVASSRRPQVRMLIGGALILGIAELFLSFTRTLPMAMIFVFLCGLGFVAMAATANSLIQVTVPGLLRGRVMAVYGVVFVGSTPFGNAFTGGIAGGFGTPVAILIDAVLALVGAGAAGIAVLRGAIPRDDQADLTLESEASSRA